MESIDQRNTTDLHKEVKSSSLDIKDNKGEIDYGVVDTPDIKKEIVIDPNDVNSKTEPSDEKKSFRITKKNKDLSDRLEQKAGFKTANDFYGALLQSFIEVKNMEGAVFQQDYRQELINNFVRVVEIFDQIEKKNTHKRDIYMSKALDQINDLNSQIESLKKEKDDLIKTHEEEKTKITSDLIKELSDIKVKLEKAEDINDQNSAKILDLEAENKTLNSSLESTKKQLTAANNENTSIIATNENKDKKILELTTSNSDLNKENINNLKRITELESDNKALEAKVTGLEDKIDTLKQFYEEQKKQFEQQINTYKEILKK